MYSSARRRNRNSCFAHTCIELSFANRIVVYLVWPSCLPGMTSSNCKSRDEKRGKKESKGLQPKKEKLKKRKEKNN